jgi:hypothetical protein
MNTDYKIPWMRQRDDGTVIDAKVVVYAGEVVADGKGGLVYTRKLRVSEEIVRSPAGTLVDGFLKLLNAKLQDAHPAAEIIDAQKERLVEEPIIAPKGG